MSGLKAALVLTTSQMFQNMLTQYLNNYWCVTRLMLISTQVEVAVEVGDELSQSTAYKITVYKNTNN